METFFGYFFRQDGGLVTGTGCSLLQPILIISQLKHAAFCSLCKKWKNAAFCSRIFSPIKFPERKGIGNFVS